MDAEAFDKIQHSFPINSQQTQHRRECPRPDKRPHLSTPRSSTRPGCLLSPLLLNTLEALATQQDGTHKCTDQKGRSVLSTHKSRVLHKTHNNPQKNLMEQVSFRPDTQNKANTQNQTYFYT